MDNSEAHLDRIEAQRSTDDQHKRRCFPVNVIKNLGTLSSRSFLRRRGDEATPPTTTIDIESVPKFLTTLRLLDLYNHPGEYVAMNSEISSAMRAGNKEFLEKMESYETPMSCFKNNKGDSILHLAAAFGHLELVKSIVSKFPSLLLELNFKDQLPLHVAARDGHLTVVKALVASVTFFSDRLAEEDRERLNPYILKDKNGDTALHSALKDLHEKTKELHEKTKDMHWLRRSKSKSLSNESTHLMETAACLVNANQDVSFLANKDEISPLYLAVEAGNVSLVNAMLNSHVNNVQDKTFNLATQLKGRKSLVHAALKAKNTDVLDVILGKYPSLVKERDEKGRTCLSVGASVGFYQGICKLLDTSTLSIFDCDDDGSFPIHKAVEKGHENVVKELLKRFPDSVEQLNKEGQNIFHISAKSGKSTLFLMEHINKVDTKNHLMEEQDMDGNTPLHLATINWRPKTVRMLTKFLSIRKKLLDKHNSVGLRLLDIAEINLQSDYVFRERMTLMVLLGVYNLRQRGISLLPTSGMTLRSRSEKLGDGEKYKDRVNILLLVAALVATMTFAAGFTMPGGFSSSAPNTGMAILVDDRYLTTFIMNDTIAMLTSVLAIVALIWAQLGDPELAHRAFHLALPALFVALLFMCFTFFYGVLATIQHNIVLSRIISFVFNILFIMTGTLLTPYVIPQVYGLPIIGVLTSSYLDFLLLFVNEDDDEKHYTTGSSHTCVKSGESMGSSSGVQAEKSKVL
ncbi:Ankyrin repeat-containing domain superfamily [Arabidopsis thaliana x Arabidopsis arenosa]|nr:Ankyrin repeat-containing domain superfamily [Arabidopsis thaliana x Arabidopsis arenosa]KAG7615014.1 Ankyrin repeat-containing domain superfamily [Arabidopsis thaliana x Arabidopsis arenosa]